MKEGTKILNKNTEKLFIERKEKKYKKAGNLFMLLFIMLEHK